MAEIKTPTRDEAQLLTPAQADEILEALAEVIRCGYGEVIITIKKGRPRKVIYE